MKQVYLSQKVWLTLVAGLLFAFGTPNLQASHFAGGEITYDYISENTYQFTMKVYRDCDGISFPSSMDLGVAPNSSLSFTVTRTAIVDITPVCPGVSTTCASSSQPVNGIEELTYIGSQSFPLLPAGEFYTIANSDCCRNRAITTIRRGSEWYISTTLDPSQHNSSPKFLVSPTAYFCVNQPVNFPAGAFDPDGDLLVYSLAPCLEKSTSTVSYLSGFSGTNPLSSSTGFSIDPLSGIISFTPDKIQVGILRVWVLEFRNGVKVGEISRDLQIQVGMCNNNPPVVAPVTTVHAPVGTPVSVAISATDLDASDIVSLEVISRLSGAAFSHTPSISPAIGTLNWTPSAADLGKVYNVIVIVRDDNCSLRGINYQSFNIVVGPPVSCNINVSGVATATNGCPSSPNGAIDLTISNATTPVAYLWTGPGVFSGFTEDLSGLKAGTYSLSLVDANLCTASASFTVLQDPNSSPPNNSPTSSTASTRQMQPAPVREKARVSALRWSMNW